MKFNPTAEAQHKTAGTAGAAPATQAARMRAAVDRAVAIAPGFLRGDIDADHMANTMVQAVRDYAKQQRAAGGDAVSQGPEAQALQNVLAELMACGSGYLAGRCDAACVARTMTQMVSEFGPH
jgi:hypothetical protein